jgi:hypothetical protein
MVESVRIPLLPTALGVAGVEAVVAKPEGHISGAVAVRCVER